MAAITFKKVRWKNFLSTGNVFTEIDLHSHPTTLIIGTNGTGKSTFIDAISFALYNKPFRNINKPQLLNSINTKNLITEIEFSVNKVEYFIRRGIKPNIFEIYQNGTLINQDASSRDYQDYLEKHILKLNHKAFSQIVTLGSTNYVPFMQLPAWSRREFNENLLDIQIFSTMHNLLKEKIADNKSAFQDLKYQIDLIEEKISMQKKHIESLKKSHKKNIESKQDNISFWQESVDKFIKEVTDYSLTVLELREKIADAEAVNKRSKEITLLEKKLEDKLDRLKKEVKFYHDNDNCPTCKQTIDEEFKNETLTQKNISFEETKNALLKLEYEYTKVSHRQAEIEQDLNRIKELEDAIKSNDTQIAFYDNQIKKEQEDIQELDEDNTSITDEELKLAEYQRVADELAQTRQTLIAEKSSLEIASVLLKDNGIKAKIIKQYIPVMNKLINKYLAAMDFFVEFTLDEQFNEKIKSRYRDDFTYASFSEGEKARLDIALLFAWRTIAKLRNSASTNLLVMDEIFDGSLDNAGGEYLINLIFSISADTNVFIISHKNENMADKFDKVIRFEKVKSFSRIANMEGNENDESVD